ncbi:MAG: nickel-dependent lactate racemase [Candidatus Fermentithermobacillus carboniphilus]|uniref:Nickel-dependent lactate racemase n=1 Tax=Candidatus Fermentithermobacillus carboniphilus TaxID=3085328 RepID=A0AAT9LF53_9FIRM|nr:MAG: nickel-dependent lactate racemase [Candidatus Fermentithermobacillus carboniphilus]
MPCSDIEMGYGKSKVRLNMPGKNIIGILRPVEPEVPASEEAEIEGALDNPIGSGRLEEIVRPGMKVVIMASDITRPSPTKKLLPPLIRRLERAGVKDEDVTVVFGTGIHRNHTEEEKRLLVGAEMYERFRCVDSTETGDFVFLGETSRGTPVEVCRPVAECDFLIGTGNVEYHYFVGYSGGAKAVLPGACSRRTVEANHSMQLLPGAEIARYDDNPVRQDIEEAGEIIGIDYIINVVLDDKKRIVKAVAGHPRIAHAAARQVVDSIYGVKIPERADIVIASAGGYPKDVNLYQAQKGLDNAGKAVRDGGTIILLGECPEGLGEKTFEKYMTEMDVDDILESIRRKFVLGGHKAAAIARILKRADVFLVSSMDPELVRRCKLRPFRTLEEALEAAFNKHGPDARVLVMPYAGSTVPLI